MLQWSRLSKHHSNYLLTKSADWFLHDRVKSFQTLLQNVKIKGKKDPEIFIA